MNSGDFDAAEQISNEIPGDMSALIRAAMVATPSIPRSDRPATSA